MAGYNFFLYEALLIPFEITALSTVLDFWSDDIPPWAIPLACIVSRNHTPCPCLSLIRSPDSLRVSFPVQHCPSATSLQAIPHLAFAQATQTTHPLPKRLRCSTFCPLPFITLIVQKARLVSTL